MKKKRVHGFLPVLKPSLRLRVPELPGGCWLAADVRCLSREGLRLFSVSSSFHGLPCRVHLLYTFPPSCFLPSRGPLFLFFQRREREQGADPGCSQSTLKPLPSHVLLRPPWVTVGHHCRQVSAQNGADRAALFSALGGSTDKSPSRPPSVVASSQCYGVGQVVTCAPPSHLLLHSPPAVQTSLSSETHLNGGQFLFALPGWQWSGSRPGQSQPSARASLPVHDEEVRQHGKEQKRSFMLQAEGMLLVPRSQQPAAAPPGCRLHHSPGPRRKERAVGPPDRGGSFLHLKCFRALACNVVSFFQVWF